MATTLFIENEPADLTPQLALALTFQVNDIADLGSRQGNYSNRFKLPLTAKNKRLLGYAHAIQSTTKLPYKKIGALLLVDGVQAMPGFLVIEELSDVAEVVFYGGNTDFFALLGDKKLNDLILTQYDHSWYYTAAYNAKNATNGYIYPVMEWGDIAYPWSSGGILNIKYSRPSLFVHSLVSKLIVAQGYSVQGAFLNNQQYLAEVMPITNDKLTHSAAWTNSKLFNLTMESSNVSPNDTDKVYYTTANSLFNDGEYVVPGKGKYDMSVLYKLEADAGLATPANQFKFKFRIMRKQAGTGVVQMIAQHSYESYKIASIWHISFEGGPYIVYGTNPVLAQQMFLPETELDNGDRIFLEVETNIWGNINILSDNTTRFRCSAIAEAELGYGQTFEFTGNLPDISQRDFLKALAHRYGLIFICNPLAKTLSLHTFKEVYDNMPDAIDWTDKLDMKEPPTIEYRHDKYAKNNRFSYKNDETLPEKYGEGFITIDDGTLPEETDSVELPFSASLTAYSFGQPTAWLQSFKFDTEISAPDYVYQQTSPRILRVKQYQFPNAIKYGHFTGSALTESSDSTSVSDPVAYFDTFYTEPGLKFKESIIPKHYKELTYMLNRFKKLTAYFKLTAIDIANLDFLKPVFLKQHAAYFYINKVSNYQPGKLTKVELVKM